MTLAVDASSPATVTGGTSTLTTTAFSPPANSLLVAFCDGDANSGNTTEALTITSTGGLTWNLAIRVNGSPGATIEVWYATTNVAPGSITVSATDNQGAVSKKIFVRVFTDSSGGTPAGIGATTGGNGGGGTSPTTSYVSTAPNSWGWGGILCSGSFAVGANQTSRDADAAFDGGDDVVKWSQNATTAAAGTTVTMSGTVGSSTQHMYAVEILPSTIAQPQALRSRKVVPRVPLYRKRGREAPRPISGLVRKPLLGQITGSAGTGNFTTSSFTPPNNCLLVVGGTFDENNGTTTDPINAFVISDSLSLTWTQRAGISVAPTAFPTCTKIWTTPITTGQSMTITLGTGGRTSFGYAASIVAYTGYDTVTPIGTTGSGSQNGGFGTPPTPASYSLNASPAASSEIFAAMGTDRDTAGVTQGTGWTKIDDLFNLAADLGLESQVLTGTTSTTVSWVDLRSGGGNLFNYASVAVEVRAFPGPAAAVAPAFPFAAIVQPRRLRGMQPRRAKPIQTVPPQFNPPFPFADVVQPRRVRGMLPKRGKQAQTVPPQFNPPFPWAEIVQPRRQRGWLFRRGKSVPSPVPPQFNPPYPWAEVVQPRRARGLPPHRGKQSQAVAPPQEQPVPEAVQPRRARGLIPRRSKPIETVPPQFNPPFPWSEIVQPRRLRGLLPRRAKPIEVVPTQITFTNPPFPWSVIAQVRKLRGYPVRRVKPIETVPPQFNPPYPFSEIVQPRRLRGMLPRRGRQAQPTPVQDGPNVEVVQPHRQRGWLLRRGKQAQPVPPQDMPVPEDVQPRRQRGWLFRRGKQAQPVPAQVNLAPPAFPPNDITSRRKQQRLAPRGRHWAPPWPQAINPIPFRDLILAFGKVSLKWVLDLAWSIHMPATAWTFNAPTTKWAMGGIVVPNPDIPLSSLSLEYVRVPVVATVNGQAVNPTGDTVKMAFLSGVSTQPQVGDWKTASWDTPGTGVYFAQCLVGPGGTITLTTGNWYVWVQVTDNPEIPVRQVGVLQVV